MESRHPPVLPGRVPGCSSWRSWPWSPSPRPSPPSVDAGLASLRIPASFSGIVIATLVLLPEGLAALRAGRANRLQTSLNLAMGSSLATIGLTIPAVAIVSAIAQMPPQLGLGAKEEVLLALTLLLGVITLGTGRTTVHQGVVHLVIFAVFLFFAIAP